MNKSSIIKLYKLGVTFALEYSTPLEFLGENYSARGR